MRDRDDKPISFHIIKATNSSLLIFTNKTVEIGRTDEDDRIRAAYVEEVLERMAGGHHGRKRGTASS